MLKQFERQLLDETDWSKIEPGLEVKLCPGPEGSQETFVLCRSPQRKEKEKAMRSRQVVKLEKELSKIAAAAAAPVRALRDRGRAERRVGRLLATYSRAAHLFDVKVEEAPDAAQPDKTRLTVTITRKQSLQEWAERADGCYLLRTNLVGKSAEELWRTYIGLTQIEDSFRIAKHDLGLRPVFHQKQDRTQAHILVCFLALALWRTLQQWMSASGLGTAPRKLLEEMAEVRSLDIVLPTPAGREIRLRTVSRPEKPLAILLAKLGLPLPNRPKRIQNVVATFDQKNAKCLQKAISVL